MLLSHPPGSGGKKATHIFENPGVYSVTLMVEDSFGYRNTTTMIIFVYEKPFAPLNVQYQTVENRSFLFTDYINRITWVANSRNDDIFNVVQYRIYRKQKGESDSQFTLVAEVNASNLMYEDRKFSDKASAENCVYAVTTVDNQGRESDPAKSGL
jgi:PKD repeat protein